MESLNVYLLGSFRIKHNGQSRPVILSTRLQSVLTYLLLHSAAPQSRQQIAFQLWPHSTERQARNNLRKALHRLRHALPTADNLLYVDTHVIQWQPNVLYTLDVTEFEDKLNQAAEISPDDLAAQQALLEESIACYQGDLLPSCYDDWITRPRARLRQRFLDALEQLTWLAEEQRNYAVAIQHAQHLLQHDPLHESTYRRLMRLHMLEGNRAAALHTYRTGAATIQRELNVAPGPEMQDAYAQVLATETPPELRSAASSPPEQWPLVGREREWRTLRRSWQQAIRGNPHFILIQGEAGIGKTRLAAELLDWVKRQGFPAAHTRSYAAQGALAYTPVAEWLRNPPLQPNCQELDHVWLTELARLLPELLTHNPDVPQPQPLTESWQRNRLFEALAHAVMATLHKPGLAQTGLLLVLDDLQWCDRDTLEWLHYLLHFEAQVPLLVVGTVRPEEVDSDHPLTSLLLQLRRTEQLTEVALKPLDQRQSAELAAEVAAEVAANELDELLSAQLYQTTEGSPLFIVETMRANGWQDNLTAVRPPLTSQTNVTSLPPKVYATIQYRLSQLSPEARELAEVAAVIGRSFTFELLQAICDSTQGDLVSSLDELWHKGIVRTGGKQNGGRQDYDFSHDRIREVAYDEVSPVRRPYLHRQIADTLYRIHNDDLDSVAAHLAVHYEVAGATQAAIDWYQQAAKVQSNRYALTEAIDSLNRALTLLATLPQSRALKQQELALVRDLDQNIIGAIGFGAAERYELLKHSAQLAREIGDTWQSYSCFSSFVTYHLPTKGPIAALKASHQLLEEYASESENLVIKASANYIVGRANFHLGNFRLAHTCFERCHSQLILNNAPEDLERLHDGTTLFLRVCGKMSITTWLLGYADQARWWSEEALRAWHAHELQSVNTNSTLSFVSYFFRMLHDIDRLQSIVEQQITIGIRYSQNPHRLNGLTFQGWVLAQRGDFAAAIESSQQGVAGFRAVDQAMFQTHRLAILIEVYLLAGDLSAASDTLDEAFAISERVGERWWDAELHRLRGHQLLDQSASNADVERCYTQALAVAQKQEAKSLELRASMSLARLWQSQGRVSEAHALLSPLYNWFTEGFDTADLQTARQLLDELSSQRLTSKSPQ